MTYKEELQVFRLELFTRVLEQHGGNVCAAARALKVNRSTLYNHMSKGHLPKLEWKMVSLQ